MFAFPTNNYLLQNRKTAIRITEPADQVFSRLYNFGYLPPEKIIDSQSWPCLLIQANAYIKNFTWQGSMGGIHIGSNEPSPLELRKPHQPIQVILENSYCEDVGLNALTIFNQSTVIVKNCNFRGNWKLNPLIENGVGQGNLVRVNGGMVVFENCKFFNSLNPILIKANSQVAFTNCIFSVCQNAILADGKDNPRPNDCFDGGKAGQTLVVVHNCKGFKTKVLAVAGTNSQIEITNCQIDGNLFREDGGKVILKDNGNK